jgi:hypothetical protein
MLNSKKVLNLSICPSIMAQQGKNLRWVKEDKNHISRYSPFKKSYNMRRTPPLSLSPLNICL